MRILIARLIWNFEVKMAGDFVWEKQHMMMLVEKADLWVRLEKRE